MPLQDVSLILMQIHTKIVSDLCDRTQPYSYSKFNSKADHRNRIEVHQSYGKKITSKFYYFFAIRSWIGYPKQWLPAFCLSAELIPLCLHAAKRVQTHSQQASLNTALRKRGELFFSQIPYHYGAEFGCMCGHQSQALQMQKELVCINWY